MQAVLNVKQRDGERTFSMVFRGSKKGFSCSNATCLQSRLISVASELLQKIKAKFEIPEQSSITLYSTVSDEILTERSLRQMNGKGIHFAQKNLNAVMSSFSELIEFETNALHRAHSSASSEHLSDIVTSPLCPHVSLLPPMPPTDDSLADNCVVLGRRLIVFMFNFASLFWRLLSKTEGQLIRTS